LILWEDGVTLIPDISMEPTIKQLKEKGKELIRQKNLEKARNIFNEIIALSPQDVYSLDVLGFINYMTGRFEEAKKNCEDSLVIKPDNYYAYKGLGLCLVRLGKAEEGIEKIKKSIELNPSYFDSYYDLAVTYMELKKYDLARHYFIEAGRVDTHRQRDIEKALRYLDTLEVKQ
jgi:tetratricopeptide (TPR) repeat protein